MSIFAPPEPTLIVVSNRLPITISKASNGNFNFRMSSGGLVSALAGCKKSMAFTWIGWPGFALTGQDRAVVDDCLRNDFCWARRDAGHVGLWRVFVHAAGGTLLHVFCLLTRVEFMPIAHDEARLDAKLLDE